MDIFDFVLVLIGLALVHILAVVSPGPSLLIVTRTSISISRNAGILNALGFGVGSIIWASAAMFGLNVLFTTFPWIYTSIKVAGALYLIFLASKMVRSQGLGNLNIDDLQQIETPFASFNKGLLVQLSNPKVVIFMGSILTTLLPKDPPATLLAAAVIIIFCNEFIWYSLVSFAFSVKKLRNGYSRASKSLDRVAGVFLGALGLRILTQ